MSREPDDPDRPREPTASDVDAAFAQIVAAWSDPPPQWQADGRRPADGQRSTDGQWDADGQRPADGQWPTDGPWPTDDYPGDDAAPTEEIPTAQAAPPVDEDEDHFVPPEPPPLPRPQPATVGAVLLFALGVILLAVPNMIGFSEQYGLPLGLLSITGAIVWLVARLRQGPPTDSGWDDGAQI